MPPEYLEMFLSADDSLPDPDAVLGLEEESDGIEELTEPPDLEVLLEDPDVAVIVEAAEGLEPVAA